MSAPHLDCTTAKALFCMHLDAPWTRCDRKNDKYCETKFYLPTRECREDSPEALELLKKVSQCLRAHQGNTGQCEQLLGKYRATQCFAPEVEERVKEIIDYAEKCFH
jgi:hypothetical protein